MTHTDLDEQLASVAAPLGPALHVEAQRAAVAAMPPRLRRGRTLRPRWVIPVIAGGLVALTAGAGSVAITMSHWGGVSIPLTDIRNEQPIPITWTTESGHEESCRVWIELRHPQPHDRATLDAAIAAREWSGLGQRLYDATAAAPSDDSDGESRVGRALLPVIRSFTTDTFPDIPWFLEGSPDARAVDAWGMICAPATE